MTKKSPPSDSELICCLKTHYGIETAKLTPLPFGADPNAKVYQAETGEMAYFVKLKWGPRSDVSIALLELLQNMGMGEIIPPIRTIEGQSVLRIKDWTLILFHFIKGENGFVQKLSDDQWIKLGKAFSQVHNVKLPANLKKQIRKENYSPKWRETVRSLYQQADFRTLVADKMEIVERLVNRAEQLAEKIQNLSPKSVLCHSDIHAENVLVSESGSIYIVDWDDPIMAPKERDLMFIGGGVGNVWNQSKEEKLFYKGYGKSEIDLTLLAYYRHERIVEDIALFAEEWLSKKGADTYTLLMGQFEPNGVVARAFKTDLKN